LRLDFLIISILLIFIRLTQNLTPLANNILIAGISISLTIYTYFLILDIITANEEEQAEEEDNDLP
jgi:hypothetical protein